MRRVRVNSSVLAEVGYDPDSAMLEVMFCSKEIYRYFAVPEDVFERLMRAESHGKFFNEAIKDKYPFIRN